MTDRLNAIAPKVAPLIRLLSSPAEHEAVAALRMLLRLLSKHDLDIHAIADRVEHGEPLSAAEMQAIYDAAYQKGYADGADHGRRSAILAAQPIGAFAAHVDSEINGYSWQQIAQHCLTNKHLFHGRDLEFVESVAESLTRFNTPTAKQAKWLRDLFMRKFGGKIT
jgi:hypothetical protein